MPSNVFSIAPSLPFLPTLAREILAGRIVASAGLGSDPLALADITVYVPSRRAERSLIAAFAEAIGGPAAILPRVRVLGQDDEPAIAGSGRGLGHGLPVMDDLERRLRLARLVRLWKSQIGTAALAALDQEGAALPASAADAVWLATDLGALLDEAADEEIDLSSLARLDVEDRLAHWWQLTLTFLSILTAHWPGYLAERGLAEPGEARAAAARRQAEHFRINGSRGPVIIAGSTATAPATIELMRAVVGLPNGAVVLPGLDRHLDDESFGLIDIAASIAAPGHPQFTLKRLLTRLGVDRREVRLLPADTASPSDREAFLSSALRPAETTDRWAEDAAPSADALHGIALVEAEDGREEALAVAVALRDAVSRPGATAALATPDRGLARRVVRELERFGILANDSAGRPLGATAPGTLLALALEAAFGAGDPVNLLALLKHPLTRLGFPAADARRAARAVETIALRGGLGRADPAELAALYDRRMEALNEDGARPPRAVMIMPEEERRLGGEFAAALAQALRPLTERRGTDPQELSAWSAPLILCLERLAAGAGTESRNGLYAEEAGAALASFLSTIAGVPDTQFVFGPEELPDVIAALAAEITVKPRAGLSSRVFVWGALEARLQSVDTMILGGLNEDSFPRGARNDAFLSRLMRAEMLLDPPERRIGLAAHDFWMAMGHPRVVLTRAKRAGGAPTIAARWLQRIQALAGPEEVAKLRAEGEIFLRHAHELDRTQGVARARRPAPAPPVSRRPSRYSVTEVERLIRDPYAVYARKVLRLEPLEPLLRNPDAAERGDLYHRILAAFVRLGHDPLAPDAPQRLLSIARDEFDRSALPPEIEAVWWPRMEALAARYIDWERQRDPDVAARHAEVGGAYTFPDIGVALSGFADRIDAMRDGTVEILDFKTGTSPSVRQARSLLAPQLPLEGAMAGLGAFEERGIAAGTPVSDLLYVRLREREFYEERLATAGGRTREPVSAATLAEDALARFRALAAAYQDPARGFQSRARPFMAGDFSGHYDHLARAREWAAGEEEEEAAAETGGEA